MAIRVESMSYSPSLVESLHVGCSTIKWTTDELVHQVTVCFDRRQPRIPDSIICSCGNEIPYLIRNLFEALLRDNARIPDGKLGKSVLIDVDQCIEDESDE